MIYIGAHKLALQTDRNRTPGPLKWPPVYSIALFGGEPVPEDLLPWVRRKGYLRTGYLSGRQHPQN